MLLGKLINTAWFDLAEYASSKNGIERLNWSVVGIANRDALRPVADRSQFLAVRRGVLRDWRVVR